MSDIHLTIPGKCWAKLDETLFPTVMTEQQRAALQQRIIDERTSLVAMLDRISSATRERMDAPERDQSPRHDSQAGASGVGPEDDRVIAERVRVELAEIDAALHTLYEHPEQYGICTMCHQPIAFARLEVIPMTRYCERHAPSRGRRAAA